MHQIPDYARGEDLDLRATLTDESGPVTSGTLRLFVGPRNGSPAPPVDIPGTHLGAGVWQFLAPASALAIFASGTTQRFEIWNTDTNRRFVEGSLQVGASLYPSA